MAADKCAPEEYTLDPETEFRFQVKGMARVFLKLKEGLAEIFGTELVKNKRYTFSFAAKIAVFTWHGCTLELSGTTEVAYVFRDTPMVVYVNLHGYLEQMREHAEAEESKGPTTLICGPPSVGKSTLCRILLNYAVRIGRSPVFVDLDVSKGQMSVPGTIGALLMERTFDVEEEFFKQAPMVFHYGHTSPDDNFILYKSLIWHLADVVSMRTISNRQAFASGTFINTYSRVKGNSYESIKHAAGAFQVNMVLVIDQEILYHELVRDLPGFVKVVMIPKSGGVVDLCQRDRAEARKNRIRGYFYGMKKSLYPHSFDVKFSDIKVYKIGAALPPNSCMPFGMKADDNNRTKLVPVQIGQNLLQRVLSVSFMTTIAEGTINMKVAGFICVTDVDMERQVLNVLSPQRGPLPKTILLLSDVQFVDTLRFFE